MLKLRPKTFLGAQQRSWSSADLCIDLSHYSAGTIFPKHEHTNAFFCFVLSGACEEYIEGRQEKLQPGSLVYHPAGLEHADTWQQDGQCLHIEIGTGFSGGVTSPRLEEPLVLTHGGRVSDVAHKIYEELLHQDSASDITFQGLSLLLLAETTRRVEHETRTSRWLKRVRDQLNEEYVAVPSLKKIAQEVGVQPTYLATSFQKQFGVSIGEFVRSRRIERARAILTTSDQPLSEVAQHLGFADQSHFCRIFKKQTSYSPLEYRRLFSCRPII